MMRKNLMMYPEDDHGCGCGCHDHGYDHECEEMATVVLSTDDGETMECGILGVFDVEERSYIALVNEESEVLLYRYLEHGEEEPTLELIDDDTEFEKVVQVFQEIFVDEEESEEDEI